MDQPTRLVASKPLPACAAAGGTSSFPVDRSRLALLLGFDAPVQNSYDAGQLAPMDTGIQLTSIAANFSTTTGSLAQDIYAQYHQISPWIFLQEGALTGPSSIMRQKRNPVALYTFACTPAKRSELQKPF